VAAVAGATAIAAKPRTFVDPPTCGKFSVGVCRLLLFNGKTAF
jgi:hypothetical protein